MESHASNSQNIAELRILEKPRQLVFVGQINGEEGTMQKKRSKAACEVVLESVAE
jgi:hypothetical protein